MHKEVISGRQLTALIFTFIIATATFAVPAFVTTNAGRDGWLSIVIASLVGILVVFVVISLAKRYPELTPIEYSEVILGKFLGKFVALIFLLFYIHITAIIAREVSFKINYNLMLGTDIELITLFIFLTTSYAVKRGLEVITRVNILIILITILMVIICTVLLIKEIQLDLLTPFLSRGIKPVLNDAVTPAGWFAEVVAIAFLIPFINKKRDVFFSASLGVLLTGLVLVFFVVLAISILGADLTQNMTFPIIKIVRIINIGNYIQNIEEFFLIPWILMSFVKLCFFYYLTSLIVARFFKLDSVSRIVMPVGLLVFCLACALFKDNIGVDFFLKRSWGYYSLPIQLGFPFLLLLVDSLRR